MLLPSIFSNDFMDDFFGVPQISGFPTTKYDSNFTKMMTTDVKETDKGFEVDMNLPGFSKEDIKVELDQGYLTINANTSDSKDEKEDGKYIRRERYTGSCSRSFYVGEDITQDDIHATFKDGVLSLDIPKKEAIPQKEEPKYISIEG
ncbi:MAG: Hsp20/alpha crystallin family protein [Pseudobutyrivibrio sp.]|nr:Hsp20/alpha crystallin family protein [Pseudobutyrivibrio sp.]